MIPNSINLISTCTGSIGRRDARHWKPGRRYRTSRKRSSRLRPTERTPQSSSKDVAATSIPSSTAAIAFRWTGKLFAVISVIRNLINII